MSALHTFYIVFFLLLALLVGFICLDRFKLQENSKRRQFLDKLAIACSIAFVVLSFVDIFMPDGFSTRYVDNVELMLENRNVFHAVLRLFNMAMVAVLPFAVVYKNKYLIKVLGYTLLPMTLVSCICFWQYLEYFQSVHAQCPFGEALRPFLTNGYFRGGLFGALNLLALGTGLYTVLWNTDKLKFAKVSEFFIFLPVFFGCLFINMPISFPQMFFGTFLPEYGFGMGTMAHLAWIGYIIVGGIFLYLVFRNKSREDKYTLLLMMSISLLFQYNSFFRSDGIITVARMPFQLCNIAAVFYIITLLTKSEKMYHAVLVMNFVGAVIAIVLCDSTYFDGKPAGIFYCMNIHYAVEHTKVALIPVLMGSLKFFKPLKKSDIKHTLIGFTLYFLSVLAIGVVCNGLVTKLQDSYFTCNFFFMFDKVAATRLVGDVVGFLFDIKITFAEYYTLTLAQLFVYFVFVLVCIGFFYLFYAFFGEKKKKVARENAE
ncbi:MAG: YwaF family protein [Clostridia bacterium]|nr:YwaF family protein [Clostridia bacterium]